MKVFDTLITTHSVIVLALSKKHFYPENEFRKVGLSSKNSIAGKYRKYFTE